MFLFILKGKQTFDNFWYIFNLKNLMQVWSTYLEKEVLAISQFVERHLRGLVFVVKEIPEKKGLGVDSM